MPHLSKSTGAVGPLCKILALVITIDFLLILDQVIGWSTLFTFSETNWDFPWLCVWDQCLPEISALISLSSEMAPFYFKLTCIVTSIYICILKTNMKSSWASFKQITINKKWKKNYCKNMIKRPSYININSGKIIPSIQVNFCSTFSYIAPCLNLRWFHRSVELLTCPHSTDQYCTLCYWSVSSLTSQSFPT